MAGNYNLMGKLFHNIPFLRILLPLILGIILAEYLQGIEPIFFILPILVLLITYSSTFRQPTILKSHMAGISLTLLLIIAGFCLSEIRHKPLNIIKTGKYHGILLEKPEEKEKSFKAEVLIKNAIRDDTSFIQREKIIVYFQKDKLAEILMPGDNLFIEAEPDSISNSGNPYEFDYKKYMSRQKIYRQVYLKKENWHKIQVVNGFIIRIQAEKIRERLLEIYRAANISGFEYQILSALTFGYRKGMDPEIKRVFASVGATHVLAVSGLHVGIIYLVLSTILGFLKRYRKTMILFPIIILAVLWFYAMVTGFSPSVLRATIMFSMLVIGDNLRRPVNIYNSLAASATLLLVINPDWFFDIGFQLSYAALLGIVFFQPYFQQLIDVKSKIGTYFLGLITMTIAAQITTAPLTLFYFNQFPTYFLLANIFIIPVSFLITCMGLIILATSFLPILPEIIALCTKILIKLTFSVLSMIENLPGALINNIQLSQLQMTLLILILVLTMFFLTSKRPVYFIGILTTFTFLIGFGTFRNLQSINQRKLIIYKSNYFPVIHFFTGKDNYILAESLNFENDKFLRNTIINAVAKSGLNEPKYIQLNSKYIDNELFVNTGLIGFSDKTIFVAQNLPTYETRFNYDLLVLKNNMIKKTVNIDNLTYPVVSYKKIPDIKNSYAVFNSGAYILNW